MFRLDGISNMIADSALQMGGSDLRWYKAIFCPYIRDDGTPCYNEDRGSPWIECPVCGGVGAVYEEPKEVRGVYTDNSNKFFPDGSGGFMRGEKTLSLPRSLDLRVLKARSSNNSRRVVRDKFELLGTCCGPDGQPEIKEVMYMKDDPKKPTINSGTIYQIVEVADNF